MMNTTIIIIIILMLINIISLILLKNKLNVVLKNTVTRSVVIAFVTVGIVGTGLIFAFLFFYNKLNSSFLQKELIFIFSIINDVFIYLMIFYYTLAYEVYFLEPFYKVIINIWAELYNLNYIKLIIISFIFKSFLYINCTLFELFNIEFSLLYSFIIPLFMGFSFYFSKNKLRFLVSLFFIFLFWYIIGIISNTFLLDGTLLLGVLFLNSSSIEWSIEYNLIFEEINLKPNIKHLISNMDTPKFEMKKSYNIIYFLSKFYFLDNILNSKLYHFVPSFFQENTLMSTYSKYYDFDSSKVLSECSKIEVNWVDPSKVPLPPRTTLEILSLMVPPSQVPLPEDKEGMEWWYLHDKPVGFTSKYPWDSDYRGIYSTLPILPDNIFHQIYYLDDVHRHPYNYLNHTDSDLFLEMEEKYFELAWEYRNFRNDIPDLYYGIRVLYLNLQNRMVMDVYRSTDPVYDIYSDMIQANYYRLEEFQHQGYSDWEWGNCPHCGFDLEWSWDNGGYIHVYDLYPNGLERI